MYLVHHVVYVNKRSYNEHLFFREKALDQLRDWSASLCLLIFVVFCVIEERFSTTLQDSEVPFRKDQQIMLPKEKAGQ